MIYTSILPAYVEDHDETHHFYCKGVVAVVVSLHDGCSLYEDSG